ncbi:hydroquinone glucosyltransferase-like [Musa acuminata AAA Group]|uniref:hydroquinone glucosyltransferase-like n=1 Tax=Musa acuminata AAA Group TaxID=214697 RepID=UPI0031DAC4F7
MTSQEKSLEKHQQPAAAMEVEVEAEVEGGVDLSPHVVMLSSPGMGHLIPLAEFARRLAVHHGFSVTLIATADFASSSVHRVFVDSLPPGVAFVTLPPVDVPDGMDITATISLTIVESLPALRRIVSGLKRTARLVAFVADLFGTDTFDLASEFGIPPFIFFASNLFLLSLSLHLPALHETMPRLPDPVTLPGCLPMHWADLPIAVKDWTTEEFTWLLHHLKRYEKAEGILVNSFQEMEPETAAVLKEKKPGQPPIHLIGPLVQNGGSSWSPEESLCLKWLDEQPDASVVYVSLGSLGVLSREQIKEMALGLEMSGHGFLWVVKSPAAEEGAAGGSNADPESYLPECFLERTKGTGLVVSFWAPQVRILSHRAVGGFLTHCGWSSTLESAVHEVPMIAWPLYAEQRMNALMLADRLKVALRVKAREDGVVRREEISAAVAELMKGEEGRAARERVRQLQVAATAAAAVGGTSHEALAEVVAKWKDSS